MTQIFAQTNNQNPIENTSIRPHINISPSVQDRVLDQILVQSSGVGLGIFISLISFVLLVRWLGAGTFINRFMENIEKGTQSLNNLTSSIGDVSKELDINHQKYVADHQAIIEKIAEVKHLIREDVIDALKEIERKLNK